MMESNTNEQLTIAEKMELIKWIPVRQRERWARLRGFHGIDHIPMAHRHLLMKKEIELIRSQQVRLNNLKREFLSFDFVPLFFILDTKCKWVMAVKSEDKYAYKGNYIAYQGSQHGFQQWPAYMGKSSLLEYSPSYEFTKNEDEAIVWAYEHSRLPDTKDVSRERIDGFPKY